MIFFASTGAATEASQSESGGVDNVSRQSQQQDTTDTCLPEPPLVLGMFRHGVTVPEMSVKHGWLIITWLCGFWRKITSVLP